MQLSTEVALGPSHIVSDGYPASPKRTQLPFNFRPLGKEIGLGLGHVVLDGAHLPQKGLCSRPPFVAHVYCGETAGWIKMPLGAACVRQPRPMSTVAKRSPISATVELLYVLF